MKVKDVKIGMRVKVINGRNGRRGIVTRIIPPHTAPWGDHGRQRPYTTVIVKHNSISDSRVRPKHLEHDPVMTRDQALEHYDYNF